MTGTSTTEILKSSAPSTVAKYTRLQDSLRRPDKILGALLDAELNLNTLRADLARLGLGGFVLGVRKVRKQGIGGSQALVQINNSEKDGHSAHSHHHHHDPHHTGHSHETGPS